MGCGCYDERSDNELGNKLRRGKLNLDSSFSKTSTNNKKNTKENIDKLSSINSSILDNSKIKIKNTCKKILLSDEKYNNIKKNEFNSSIKSPSKEQILCNISWINFNSNEKQKFQIKISKSASIADLINLIQIEMNRLNLINP